MEVRPCTVFVFLIYYVLVPGSVTSSTCSNRCTSTVHSVAYTCPDALAQIQPTCTRPGDRPRTCLLSIAADSSLTFDVMVAHPYKLIQRLDGYSRFNRNTTTEIILELVNPLDVETVYLDVNVTSLDIQLKVFCKDSLLTIESAILNLTIVDEDDNSPAFSHAAEGTCVLPAFTASAHEHYIGPLTTSPSCICATDGDFVTNNDIVLSFLHEDPLGFSRFFAVDVSTNTINKTSNMSSDDPRSYTVIIQATEASAQGRSVVAVLNVGIESGYPSLVMTEHKANEKVRVILQILSATILTGFGVGFIILVWHRNRRVKPVPTKTKHKVIQCFKPNIIDESSVNEDKSQCAKRTEWTLESIEEEPELTSL
ncbi:uncharacterized protein [Argopecten irradians]|uniref:uncharacterized protein n=1 Tax=Argopecten irradians TaxID=31199 RepID=UPI0037170B11